MTTYDNSSRVGVGNLPAPPFWICVLLGLAMILAGYLVLGDVMLVTVISTMFIGWVSSSKLGFIVCALTGLFLARLVARSKADKHPAFAMHWAYWSLPNNPLTDMKATPPSHIRRMVG